MRLFFPRPLTSVGLRLWPFLPLCGRVSPSNGQLPDARRNIHGTVLLLRPRDCGQVPVHPRKSSHNHVAAAFQGLWQITTRIWHQASPSMTLFQHQRMWLFSRVYWRLFLWGATQPLLDVFPVGEPHLPVWPKDPWTPLCSWGFALLTIALPVIELQGFRLCTPPVYRVLMEFKCSLFSLLPFLVQSPWLFPLFHFISSCFYL